MSQPIRFKEPKIIRAARGWFISLYYLLPDNSGYKRFEISGGVNYIKNLQEREKVLQNMLTHLKKQLQNGFNPFLPELEQAYKAAIEEKKESIAKIELKEKNWTLADGCSQYLTYCKEINLSENSLKTYNSYLGNFMRWLEIEKLQEVACCSVDEDFIKKFLDDMQERNSWSPRTYNNHLNFMVAFFSRLQKLEKRKNKAIRYEIDLSDVPEKKTRAEKNRYYTEQVAEKVKKELVKDEVMFNYVKWVFYSCMRPREIRHLQVQHIDLSTRQIKATGPTAKTGDRYVPICDELAALIKKMEIDKLPLNYFIFGYHGVSSAEIASRDYYTKRYKPIKEKLGLDDKYTLYGWKHTRVVNLLMAGFTDQEVMSLTGHSDYQSFMAYKRELMVDTQKMKGKTISL